MTPRHETRITHGVGAEMVGVSGAPRALGRDGTEDTIMTTSHITPGFPGCPIHYHTTDGCDTVLLVWVQ